MQQILQTTKTVNTHKTYTVQCVDVSVVLEIQWPVSYSTTAHCARHSTFI